MRTNQRILFITSLAIALAVGCALAPLFGQVQIEKRRPAPANGYVSVENSFGSVTIKAWDNAEVMVQGQLAPGAEGLDFDGDEEGVDVDVEVPDAWYYASDDDSEYQSHLTIFAPAGNSVWVETTNAPITVEGFSGEIEIETVNGTVTISGAPRTVEVEGMTGRIDVRAAGAPMSIESISGAVVLHGVVEEVEVQTVSGSVEVVASGLESAQIETTSGDVSFQGSLCPGRDSEGELEISTFSGAVGLVLPRSVQARFELSTFSGEIHNEIGPKSLSSERFTPFKKLRFNTGADDCEVVIDTHNADITLQVEG